MLDKERYAVKVIQVQEVLLHTKIAPVPGAPSEVLGIINLRGNVVTVVDARTRFGMDPCEVTKLTRILMVDIKGKLIGVVVDSVTEVIELKDEDVESVPDINSSATSIFIQGITNIENELHILVNLDKLISEEELEMLA
ncbi:MAG: chemotaxis protein CheW [Piscirickettsiaceae bacterium]|nr:MAG: chemotaxis protein CheW [Piscirickettsiaceae bacterium]